MTGAADAYDLIAKETEAKATQPAQLSHYAVRHESRCGFAPQFALIHPTSESDPSIKGWIGSEPSTCHRGRFSRFKVLTLRPILPHAPQAKTTATANKMARLL